MSPDTGSPFPIVSTSCGDTAPIRRLMRDRIRATGLDLRGLTVLTEAATGAYAATPVIAAMAGAERVWAFTRSSRHGTAAQVGIVTRALARSAGVEDQIEIVQSLSTEILASTDILTNSGHLRPINGAVIDRLPARAVIALMFEAWEFREDDIDQEACRRREIPIVGVNERHPAIGVFPFLGPLCVRLLRDAGLTVAGQHIAVLCDNPFASFLRDGLIAAGARAEVYGAAAEVPSAPWDALLVALRPDGRRFQLAGTDIAYLSRVASQAVLVQFWGDVDREDLRRRGIFVWPPRAPRPGHMAILLSTLGPEPIIRLQTGGLRAAELVRRGRTFDPGGIADPLQPPGAGSLVRGGARPLL